MSVRAEAVTAVVVRGGRVRWAGHACYRGATELADVIARLAAEAPRRSRHVRVALERDVVQLRTLLPAPPLRARAAPQYVALQAHQLFRRNGDPLVTDSRVVRTPSGRALWAAAAPHALLHAVVDGCEQAGLRLDALGPAADVLPRTLAGAVTGEVAFANGGASEVLTVGKEGTWRSRRVRGALDTEVAWRKPLARLGGEAPRVAAAYAVSIATPRLSLLPPEARSARRAMGRRRLLAWTTVACLVWCIAGAIYAARLVAAARAAERQLTAVQPALDSALAVRQDVRLARSALLTLTRAQRTRSRTVGLLADLTTALGDSTFLTAFRLSRDSTLRLVGYAPVAARALVELERVGWLRDVRFEGPPSREVLDVGPEQREWDRFSVVARLEIEP